MALTFPRDLPSLTTLASARFEIDRADTFGKDGAGKLGGVQLGWPLWRLDLAWGDGITEAESDEWAAWVLAQRGPQRTFWGFNPMRRQPAHYPTGVNGMARAGVGGTLDANGDASSWSINANRDVLTLNGMPNGFRLRYQDLVGFRWSAGAKRTASRVVEEGAATAGGVLVVTIEPPLHSSVPASGAGCVAHVALTKVLMRLDPTKTEVGEMNEHRVRPGRISALQEFVP